MKLSVSKGTRRAFAALREAGILACVSAATIGVCKARYFRAEVGKAELSAAQLDELKRLADDATRLRKVLPFALVWPSLEGLRVARQWLHAGKFDALRRAGGGDG